jgi:hypothetical protein
MRCGLMSGLGSHAGGTTFLHHGSFTTQQAKQQQQQQQRHVRARFSLLHSPSLSIFSPAHPRPCLALQAWL